MGTFAQLEGALAEGAAQVEAMVRGETAEGGGESPVEGAGPSGAGGEDAGQDFAGRLGRIAAAGVRDGDEGAAEDADGGGFEAGVAQGLGG